MEDAAASALPNAPPEAPPEPFDVDELKGPQPFDVESLQAAAPSSVPPLRAAMQPGQQFSPGVVARFRNGDAVSALIRGAINGAYEGFGSDFPGFSPENRQALINAGVYPSAADQANPSIAGSLRFLNQSLLDPIAFVGDTFLRLFPAAVEATHQGVTAVAGKEAGQEAAQALQIAGTDASIQMNLLSATQMAEATRIQRMPDGTHVDQQLGPVPDETAAAVQAQRIADYHGMPDAAETIKESYHQGVLPVEIHTDMSPEITADLAAKEVPKAYPVSDWTGAATEPQGARAEAALGTTEAPKPTGPTRLRPIGDQGETSVSGLAETAEASAINKQLVENFGDLPELGVAKDATQGPKAEALLLKDPELARDIALNGKQPPPGTLASAVYVAVLRKAERDGDIELIRQLGTQSQFLGQVRRMGQESSYLRNVNEGDPSVAINNLQQARREVLAAKGVDVQANDNFARQEFAPIRAATKAPKPIGAWEKFMAQIRCAE